MFPHYEDDEKPNKTPKKGYFPKRRESEDKGVVASVKKRGVSGRTDATSLERNSKSSIH